MNLASPSTNEWTGSNPSRIQEKLGWKAKYGLEEAVRSAWEFKMRQQSLASGA